MSRVLGFIGFIGWFKMVYLTGLLGLQGFSGVGAKSRAGTVVAVAGLAVTRSRMSIHRTCGNLGPLGLRQLPKNSPSLSTET